MSEVLHGREGNDQLNVRRDKTQVYGLSGNDTLISDDKNDVLLIGGSGDDSLIMNGGNGTLAGGTGSNVFELNYSVTNGISALIEDFDPSKDKIVVNFDGKFPPQLTSIVSGDDVVLTDYARLFNVTLKGVRENDYVDSAVSDEAWEVLKLTNDEREKKNLSPLTMSEDLMIGAASRAQEISTLGESGALTDHKRPNSQGEFYTVIVDKDLNLSLSSKYLSYAENLQAGASSPEEVITEWMNSPNHEKNILDNQDEDKIQSKKLGVGYLHEDTLEHEHYWVQLFADGLSAPETVSVENLLTEIPKVNKVSKSILLREGPDTYSNSDYGATIAAKGGNDSIVNSSPIVSISGGRDKDTIENSGSFATINGGASDDQISLSGDAKENVIQYAGGNDFISGFNEDDTLKIFGGEYTPVTVGNDLIVAVGTDSITLEGAATLLSVNIEGTRSNSYILTEGNDTLSNTVKGATIEAKGGDDTISNSGANVTINGGAGNDSLVNNGGENVSFFYESGSDTIEGFNSTSTLKLSEGNYSSVKHGNDLILMVSGSTDSIKILGAANLERVNILDAHNRPARIHDAKNIDGTEDADSIINPIDDATIRAFGGDDTITNTGENVLIDGGADADSISNNGSTVTISGGDAGDTIENSGRKSSINGGAGDDSISNTARNVTLSGGKGNDVINVEGSRNVIEYVAGDGSDTINGLGEEDTLKILGGSYSSTVSGNDVIVTVAEDKITLVDAASLSAIEIDGTLDSVESGSGEDSGSIPSGALKYNGNSYYLFNEGMTWEEAKAYCESLGGHLVVITDEAEQAAVEGLLKEKGTKNSYWMGGFKGENPKLTTLTEGDDTYTNTVEGAKIQALGGNDSITNYSDNVSIDAGAGNDTIYGTLNGGNWGSSWGLTVNGGEGDDYIRSSGDKSSISGGADNDTINNYGASSTLNGDTGNDYIYNSRANSSIDAGADNDTISNYGASSTLDGGTGNDYIYSYGRGTSISGGDGDDTITSRATLSSEGLWNTINAGAGDDYISLGGGNNQIFYNAGDGSDTITGLTSNDTINIFGTTYTRSTIDNDVILSVDDDSITLKDAANLSAIKIVNDTSGSSIENSTSNTLVTGTSGNDTISNSGNSVTITALAGNDSIYNTADSVSIISGADDDTISNGIYHGTGSNVTIDGGDGNNFIENWADSVTIGSGEGNDYINNSANYVSIEGGGGDDNISNAVAASSTIYGGAGKDSIFNQGDFVSIDGGSDNDSITNYAINVTISGGEGDDSISNASRLVTIVGGTGNDRISLSSVAINNLIQYTSGDGDDTISGFNDTSTLSISGAEYSTATSGDDVIVYINDGENFITLVGAASLASVNITSGGSVSNVDITNSTSNTVVTGTSGDDTLRNYGGRNATIAALAGNDFVDNHGNSALVEGGDGNDTLYNYVSADTDDANYSTVRGGLGDDFIDNHGNHALIDGGAGNDTIDNYAGAWRDDEADYSTLLGGSGNDFIDNEGNYVSIDGGAGNDSISNSGSNVLFNYTSGDGDDTISGFNSTSTLSISGAEYSTTTSGNDVIVTVGDGSIRLVDAASLDAINIEGTLNSSSEDGGSWQWVTGETWSYTNWAEGEPDDSGNYLQMYNVVEEQYNKEKGKWDDTANDLTTSGTGIEDQGFICEWEADSAGSKLIRLTEKDDIYGESLESGSTLEALGGKDSISNVSANVTIDGGRGNDTLYNQNMNVQIDASNGDDVIYNHAFSSYGREGDTFTIDGGFNTTIIGGKGDDSVYNEEAGMVYVYRLGDGDDKIRGFGILETLVIDGAEFTTVKSGDDVIVQVGKNELTLEGAANLAKPNIVTSTAGINPVNIIVNDVESSVMVNGVSSSNWIRNDVDNVTINGGTSNDDIYNGGSNVVINVVGGYNQIRNSDGSNVKINSGTDDDLIINSAGNSATISSGDGNDSIYNQYYITTADDGSTVAHYGNDVSISAGDGDDYILTGGSFISGVVASSGAGNDQIYNASSQASINGGSGNDTIQNDGNDTVSNAEGTGFKSTLLGGAGDDSIINNGGAQVMINAGGGSDTISNNGGSDVSILGGTGNDEISLSSDSKNNFIRYSAGDGNDTIWGSTKNDTINILADGWTGRKQGNDIFIELHDAKGAKIKGSILLKNAWIKPPHITLGESGSSGGGTGGGMGGSGSGSGGGSGGGSGSTGGTSGSSASNSAASGGNSASGSSGISSATSGGSNSGRGSATTTRRASATATPPVQTIRNQVISNYRSGDKINFGESHTGAFFDNSGNFYSGSTTGAVVIPEAMNKLIDLRDTAGNPFIKAYAASNAGVIDGRKLLGFEVINGSAGADDIYAGRNGAQMSGGYGNDTLTGGNGIDIFVTGKAQGRDLIRNASLLDKVKLTDVTLNDIISSQEDDKTISLKFRTGNVVTVERKDILSPEFIFADGSAYLYNNASKSWRIMKQASTNQNVYAGGEQTISNYKSGDKIVFNAEYRGGSYDGEGNFKVNSQAGTLVVKNAVDKVIDLTNSWGNSFVKAYAASSAGVIDGRELTGYEIINGSAGADVICAGNGGSQLWGGAEADVLVGGNGADTFITGKTQGADLIRNASSFDTVNLNDSTLSDIVATSESNGTISLSFNNGNVVNVQSSELLSARFTLNDGSAYRYNHATKSWQSA